MKDANTHWRKICLLCIIILLPTAMGIGLIEGYFPPSEGIPLEVKEPLKILNCPMAFSLFPGEIVDFNIILQNLVSVNYSVALDFSLNDTAYQAEYVTFSDKTYTIISGEQNLTAWLKVASEAPPGTFVIAINVTRKCEETPTPAPSPEPSPTSDSIMPLVQLLTGGARWAAQNGTSALYVNWNDNWDSHHLTDGVNWEWFSETARNMWYTRIGNALTHSGFQLTYSGDIPENIDDYDLVVILAYYAVEPHLKEAIRNYISNGGGVVLLAGVPPYFAGYSKVLSTGTDLTLVHEWLGCSIYTNSGGSARPAFDNPFGTGLSADEMLPFVTTTGRIVNEASPSHAAVASLNEDSQAIALWSTGLVFAFTHEYGYGRVYYQATV